MGLKMYTKLDDQRQAKIIIKYMETHPNCSIKELARECIINRKRIRYIASQGYFTLPKWNYNSELDKRFENREYVSVNVGREYGKWTGY
jgi:hypothetical protein